MTQREEFIQGLRDVADFFESRPELPVPSYGNDFNIWEKSLANAAERTRQMSPCEKKYIGEQYFELNKEIGPHSINIIWSRDEVCERVQVGTERIAEQVIPAYDKPVYEWNCSKPLLASGNQITQGDD